MYHSFRITREDEPHGSEACEDAISKNFFHPRFSKSSGSGTCLAAHKNCTCSSSEYCDAFKSCSWLL